MVNWKTRTPIIIIRVYSTAEMFDLLLSGKVDYMLFSHYSGRIAAKRMGVDDKIVVAKKDLVVDAVCLGLARQSSHIDLLPAINREIPRLHEKGRIDALITEHMNRYLLKVNRPALLPYKERT